MSEVLVTGLAAIAPCAMTAHALHNHILDGHSCLRSHEGFRLLGFPNPVAGYIDEGQWQLIAAGMRPDLATSGRRSRLAMALVDAALSDAGLPVSGLSEARTVFHLGSNKFCADLDAFDHVADALDSDGKVDLDQLIKTDRGGESALYRTDEPGLVVARVLGLANAPAIHSDACAAGTVSIGSAYRAIAEGRADIAICGAVELLCNEVSYFNFHGLGALSARADLSPAEQSRPFTRDRSGFVLSEGGAILVLESSRHAQRRGARVRGRLLGFDNRCEAQKITASDPGGVNYAECMSAALVDAGLEPEDIDHVNAHGTSTRMNDACEAAALERLFGARLSQISITANKSALGHSLAASGALEAVLTLIAIERGEVLPTLNCTLADREYPDLRISDQPCSQVIRHAVSNSFGFGGQNSCLVIGAAA